MSNIYPIKDELVSITERERYLNQYAHVYWLTGLSGSGKSTIAKSVERSLFEQGYLVKVLDGDDIRSGLCRDLDFSPKGRKENIRRIAEAAKLLMESGVIVICSFISPMRTIREMAKEIVGVERFSEVYINTPLETCESRDTKGLYAKARKGKIAEFTGVSAPYETPTDPALVIDTSGSSILASAEQLEAYIISTSHEL